MAEFLNQRPADPGEWVGNEVQKAQPNDA